MAGSQAWPMTADDVQFLVRDLEVISGTLSEIATCWRRALPYLPGLPLGLPVRLQEVARDLAAGVRSLDAAGPGQPPDLALIAAERFAALRDDIASARARTHGPGMPDIGDTRLWESVSAAMHPGRRPAPEPHRAPGEDQELVAERPARHGDIRRWARQASCPARLTAGRPCSAVGSRGTWGRSRDELDGQLTEGS